ncbi:hypothetical protein [Acuticoccus sp. I52.16.1]|uniref:hypothetical protein n=1 Tax=Acuticoccus sp. I52.16.1 TaxID=2928472 RepID=UPI001FD35CD5|nr:hypothetical protein [Acuticoccus sp. I52.16.1]UOM36526.1 hypothetical protein MRB58_10195 [Acuticoccus sp. I52.16.1]
MRTILAAILLLGAVGTASAQTSITVRPYGDGAGGTGAYDGPYRNLPGVAMFRGRAVPVTPRFADGGVKVPSYQKIENEQNYSQSTLPILDGWHATLSDGWAF